MSHVNARDRREERINSLVVLPQREVLQLLKELSLIRQEVVKRMQSNKTTPSEISPWILLLEPNISPLLTLHRI